MAEYISRETLLKAVEKLDRLDKETNTKYEYDKKGYILLIQNAPTADVVEVVRCKDCKYLYCFSAIDRQFYCKHFPKGLQGINIVEENPFCSYGERKDT